MQLHPQSLQLFELMCWCWSDKPQHRPTFEQILKVIKTDSFTHLLEATPIMSSRKNPVTAACVNFSASQSQQSASNSEGPMIVDNSSFTYSTATKVLSPVEIWYGTHAGSSGVIQFHKSITIKVCMHNFKTDTHMHAVNNGAKFPSKSLI